MSDRFVKVRELTWKNTNRWMLLCTPDYLEKDFQRHFPTAKLSFDLNMDGYIIEITFENEADEVEFMMKESL